MLIPLPAEASPGFLLTQADAAHAEWIDEDISGCRVDLAVGFVEGTLQLPLGSVPNPDHSDVAATLSVDCGTPVTLVGVTPAADCVPPPVMVSLDSALVTCVIDLPGNVDAVTIDGLS